MNRAGKRDAVSDAVGSSISNRPNMSRLHLRATAAVNDLEPRYRAGILIGGLDGGGEGAVPKWTRNHLFNNAAVFVERAIVVK